MFGLIEVATGAKAVIPLVAAVIKVIEKLNHNQQDSTFAQVVQQVRIDTLECAQGLRNELSGLVLHPIGVLDVHQRVLPLDLPLNKFGNHQSCITDPIKKRRIQKHRDRIGEIHRDLTASTDHLAAVLACMQRTSGLGEAYGVAESVRRDLDEILLKQPGLRSVLESYTSTSSACKSKDG